MRWKGRRFRRHYSTCDKMGYSKTSGRRSHHFSASPMVAVAAAEGRGNIVEMISPTKKRKKNEDEL